MSAASQLDPTSVVHPDTGADVRPVTAREFRARRNADICARYAARESLRAIGAVHGMSAEGVRLVLLRAGMELRPRGGAIRVGQKYAKSAMRAERALAARKAGDDWRQIASAIGVSAWQTARELAGEQMLREAGLF